MRTTKATREKLENAAAASGRSLAQEVELRLERSFFEEELLIGGLSSFYGHELAAVLLMIGDGMRATCQVSNALMQISTSQTRLVDNFVAANCLDTPFAFDQAVRCANTILEALRPPGAVEVPHSVAADDSDIGEIIASRIADETLSGTAINPHKKQRAQLLRKLLGPAASRLNQLLETESTK